MRARECAGFEASSIVPRVGIQQHGCAVGSDQDSRRRWRPAAASVDHLAPQIGREGKRKGAPAGIKRNLDLRFGFGGGEHRHRRLPACAEESFAPRTLIKEPGAAARATRSAVLTTPGSSRRCGASVEYTPNPCTAAHSWFSPGSRRTSVTGACGKPVDRLPWLGRLSTLTSVRVKKTPASVAT